MSTKLVNCEEYELFLIFKKQIDSYVERYQELSLEIVEKEKYILRRNAEFEENKRRAYEILDIINKDIEKTRKELEKLKVQAIADRLKLKILEDKICLLEKINQEKN